MGHYGTLRLLKQYKCSLCPRATNLLMVYFSSESSLRHPITHISKQQQKCLDESINQFQMFTLRD